MRWGVKMRKFLIFLLLMLEWPAYAGTITFQVTETSQTTATKTYNLPDSQIDRMVAAYQSAANLSVGGTASRAQVLNFIASQLVLTVIVQYVLSAEQQTASVSATSAVAPITPQ